MELHYTRREEWHKWLQENHTSAKEAWLVFYKKPSGKKRIPYNDAVEEALIFGWIDGKLKRINEEYYIQRFTPRRPDSSWSEVNVARVKKLIAEGKMTKAGLDAYSFCKEMPLSRNQRMPEMPEIPGALLEEFRKNIKASENFSKFPASVRRNYLYWITIAKKPETFQKRVKRILELSEKNIKNSML